MIPRNIDCESELIKKCDYYQVKDCPETCAYAKDMESREYGIGAMVDFGVGRFNTRVRNRISRRR